MTEELDYKKEIEPLIQPEQDLSIRTEADDINDFLTEFEALTKKHKLCFYNKSGEKPEIVHLNFVEPENIIKCDDKNG